MSKNFKLTGDQIDPLIPGLGGAIATDSIMVDGKSVGIMERYEPGADEDSGWVFYAEDDTQDYLDDSANSGVYSLNTIANYDQEIIGFLTYPAGTRVERNAAGRLALVDDSVEAPNVVLMHPANEGVFHITDKWSVDLSETMYRRFDNGSLVIWKQGLTVYINCTSCDDAQAVEEKLLQIIERRSPDSGEITEEEVGGIHKYRYQLSENGYEAVNMIAGGLGEVIIMAAYFEEDTLLTEIQGIWDSLKRT